MDFSRLRDINLANEQANSQKVEKTERELADLRGQEVFVKSIQSLAQFIEGHTTKTVVLNQIKDFATSENIESLGKLLIDVIEELKTHKNTDLTPVVDVLNQATEQLKAIPKDHQEINIPEPKDYTERFGELLKATNDVLKAIKAQKTTVEAPVVNVEAPNVEVEAPDLKPLGKDLEKSFKSAVSKIVIPKPIDNTKQLNEIVKQQKRTNTILEELPVGGGSSGGGSANLLVEGEQVSSTNPVPVEVADVSDTVTSSTDVSLASSASSAQLLAANASRSGLLLNNTDANAVYLYYGTTATASKFTVKIPADAYWEMPQPIYTGRIDVIWAADGSGSLIGSEL